MSRIRVMLLTSGLLLLTATLALNGWAQGPGGGQGRGGGGRGGFGGPGGFGGRGGFGGPGGDSLLSLALRSVVQEELKVTDKQKNQLTALNEDYTQRRQRLFERMRQQDGNGNGGGRRGGRNNNAAQGGAGAAAGGNGDRFVSTYEISPYALNANQQQGQGQQPQNDQREEGRARFQQMREASEQLEQQANQTLARVLSGKQFQRLNQIQIQSQGLNALVRPDVAEKIQLDETQVVAIQAVLNDRRTAQREVFSKQGEFFRFMRNRNGGGENQDNAGAASKDNGQAGAAAKGDIQANAANGNGGGRRRGGGGPPDREAMKKFMEQPEVKAQFDQVRSASEKLDNKATQAAYKVLTKYQLAAYKKLQGAPFDVTKLRPNFGGPGRERNSGDAASKSANGSSTEKSADPAKDTASSSTSKKSTTAKSKTTKSTSKSKRSTQRQQSNNFDGGDAGQFNFDEN